MSLNLIACNKSLGLLWVFWAGPVKQVVVIVMIMMSRSKWCWCWWQCWWWWWQWIAVCCHIRIPAPADAAASTIPYIPRIPSQPMKGMRNGRIMMRIFKTGRFNPCRFLKNGFEFCQVFDAWISGHFPVKAEIERCFRKLPCLRLLPGLQETHFVSHWLSRSCKRILPWLTHTKVSKSF